MELNGRDPKKKTKEAEKLRKVVPKNVEEKSIIDNVIDYIPVELHLPSYQYLGPGTRVEERVARGDAGKNPLDSAAKDHDVAYLNNENRHLADKILTNRAFSRLLASDSETEEKAAALLTVCCLFGKLSMEKLFSSIAKLTGKEKKKKKKQAKKVVGDVKKKSNQEIERNKK